MGTPLDSGERERKNGIFRFKPKVERETKYVINSFLLQITMIFFEFFLQVTTVVLYSMCASGKKKVWGCANL